MAITQQIQQFPSAPNSQTDTPTEFNAKADAFVHHQADTYVTEVNTWATQANALEGNMNQIKTDIDNIAGSIPTGTINDGTVATDKVWSSNKTNIDIQGVIPKFGEDGNHFRWTKWLDGTITMHGRSGSDANGESVITFPVQFADLYYYVNAIPEAYVSTTNEIYSIKLKHKLLATATMKISVIPENGGNPGSAGGTWIRWIAHGRWK